MIFFQESLAFCSEQCPPPVPMKALSPSPLARHSGGRGGSSRRSQTSFHQAPLTPVWKPIPLITKTGPTGNLNTDTASGNWITITRQHSQPVEPSASRMLCNCRFCTPPPPTVDPESCQTCSTCQRSPTLHVCCENYGSPCAGRRRSQFSPKRVSSVCGADDFATIAADSMKVTGGFKQFKQVISFLNYLWSYLLFSILETLLGYIMNQLFPNNVNNRHRACFFLLSSVLLE